MHSYQGGALCSHDGLTRAERRCSVEARRVSEGARVEMGRTAAALAAPGQVDPHVQRRHTPTTVESCGTR